MVGISGFGHVSFTVTDLERSARWYEDVLGLKRVADIDKGEWRKVIFEDPVSLVVLSLTHHGERSSHDTATEFRTGLDHLSFVVPSHGDLELWLERLDQFDVPHTEILETTSGWVLVFRDPDNIQLELYAARHAVDASGRGLLKPPAKDDR